MMISGIYYLILHRKRSEFCSIDFNTKIGKERLRTGVRQMSELLFDGIQKKKEMLEIAERLRAEGVSEEIISKCVLV
jgi:hypothetical protein